MKKLLFYGLTSILVLFLCGCKKTEDKTSRLESVSLDVLSLELNVGDNYQFTVTPEPENLEGLNFHWESSDESIASVNQNGYLTALKAGSASIKVSAEGKVASCEVLVNKVNVEEIQLDRTSADLKIGTSLKLNACITPEDATCKTIKWSSSDQKTATVDENGLVTALNIGTCSITASADGKNAECKINVLPIEAESITLNFTDKAIQVGKKVQITATVLPENTTYPQVTWSSSDEEIVSVDQNGLAEGLKLGKCTITAQCGNINATCEVEVMDGVIGGNHEGTDVEQW